MNELFTTYVGEPGCKDGRSNAPAFFSATAMSLLFTILAIIRDAKAGTDPFLWRLITLKGEREKIVWEAWKDVGQSSGGRNYT